MFGEFEFGTGLFGDGAGAPVPPTPTPVTFQRLRVECKTNDCTGIAIDSSFYSIENAPVAVAVSDSCLTNDCTGIAADAESFSLQDALFFNGTPVTVVVTCPPGANCTPGSFPPTVTYPPGTFVFPDVPLVPGEPINLCLKGCQSTVCRNLPADATPAQINAAVSAIIAEVAAQQAQCDFFPEFPFGTQIVLGDFSEYTCLNSAFADTIAASVSPGTSYPVTFGIIGGSLPTGITMISNVGTTATFTGTPTVAGNYTFTLRGTTADGVSATRGYSISIVGITTAATLPDATIGEPYSVTLAATGMTGTLLWGIASGPLPPGLVLNTATGEISGTPTTDDPFSFAIFVQNNDQVCAKVFTLDVGVCLITTASPLPSGTEGDAYSTTLAATDITGTLTWSIIAGALPDGLTLNSSTGEISGTPTTAETANFTAQVENGSGNTCSKEFSLEIEAASICGSTPAAVQDLVWVVDPLTSPPCSVVSFSGGSGTWSIQRTDVNGACFFDAGRVDVSADICNPGAPYLITVTMPWNNAGIQTGIPPFQTNFRLHINGVQVDNVIRSTITGPFTDVVMTGTLPTGALNTIRISVVTSGQANITTLLDTFSTTPTLITPLTPP